MPVLSPKLASLLADESYNIKDKSAQKIYRTGSIIDKHFDFDLSSGPVQGVSGGFWSHLFNWSTGFALIGKGKGKYAGDIVVAVRGTASLRDAITDLHIGLTVSNSNTLVHAGFNKTFNSMKSAILKQIRSLRGKGLPGTIHCVGHSLGGALAGLTADWLKSEVGGEINLYTFGAPRVGHKSFALKTTDRLCGIYRCTHGADPVPKVPLWPFCHAPYNGSQFRLDSSSGFNPSAHSMGKDGSPGYVNTANSESWNGLQSTSDSYLDQAIRLRYENRHQAKADGHWADRIGAALVTLLKDAGYYSTIIAQAAISSTLTVYDLIARTLDKVAKVSAKLADQTMGLLGHMLAFAGRVAYKITELSYKVIKWIFDKTLGTIYKAAGRAVDAIF